MNVVVFEVREDGSWRASGNAYHDAPVNRDSNVICGKPGVHALPRVNADGTGVDVAYSFCVVPNRDHHQHPLPYCFAKATPCQVLLHAPFDGAYRAEDLGHWLQMLVLVRFRAQQLEREDFARSRGTLVFWTNGAGLS